MGYQRILATLAIAPMLILAAAPSLADTADHPVLGSGNGVDHATLLTRSLVRTSKTFSDLGFTVSPLASYENGFENSTIWFADGTYLELFGVHDVELVAKSSESHAADGPEGLTWVTLDTSSITQTVAYLKARGHSLFGPEVLPEPTAWSYKLAGLESDTLPGRRLYVIEYNDDRIKVRREAKLEAWRLKETHRNSAQGLHAVWIAVRSLPEAEKIYSASGFTPGRSIALPHLKAVGREISIGGRAIILMQPAADSPASDLLKNQPATFAGYSLRVQDLSKAKLVLAENGMANMVEHAGPFGRSLLVPPAKAGGSWLELFE